MSLETTNASFYKCVSENSESRNLRSVFKRLAKIEREHADIVRKYLDLEPIEFAEEKCSLVDQENIIKARETIIKTIEFYKNASNEAREPKINGLFRAIGGAEENCLELLDSITGKKYSNEIPLFVSK